MGNVTRAAPSAMPGIAFSSFVIVVQSAFHQAKEIRFGDLKPPRGERPGFVQEKCSGACRPCSRSRDNSKIVVADGDRRYIMPADRQSKRGAPVPNTTPPIVCAPNAGQARSPAQRRPFAAMANAIAPVVFKNRLREGHCRKRQIHSSTCQTECECVV